MKGILGFINTANVLFGNSFSTFHINLSQALHSGLARVLTLCEQQSWTSVALPIIGPGLVLSVPVKDGVNILTREITTFLSGFTGSLHTIYITIMPNDAQSEEVTICNIQSMTDYMV